MSVASHGLSPHAGRKVFGNFKSNQTACKLGFGIAVVVGGLTCFVGVVEESVVARSFADKIKVVGEIDAVCNYAIRNTTRNGCGITCIVVFASNQATVNGRTCHSSHKTSAGARISSAIVDTFHTAIFNKRIFSGESDT